jgi:hypothetical protein
VLRAAARAAAARAVRGVRASILVAAAATKLST